MGDLRLGQIRYSLVTNEQGGILDDVLVGYYHDEYGQPFYVLVVNASNRAKIVRWIEAHLPRELAEADGREIIWADVTRLWAMFAIQGPRSVELLQPLVDVDLQWMRYYRGTHVRLLHPAARRQGAIISRTGYTGEDGFELSLGAGIARDFWEVLLDRGKSLGIVPAGLGARDTLRLEAAMPLYSHELSEQINPFEAGLGYACHLTGCDFPGRDALKRLADEPLRTDPDRPGVVGPAHRPAAGRALSTGGRPIGLVTSGTFSPTLEKSIAMGYVPPEYSRLGTELAVDLRGRLEPARVVELPFYRRSVKGTPRVTPEQLLFTKTHEWVHVEQGPAGKIATVGITAFAIEALTDLVFIEVAARWVERFRPASPSARSSRSRPSATSTVPWTARSWKSTPPCPTTWRRSAKTPTAPGG